MRDNTFKMITRKMPIITTLILVTLLPSSAINAWTLFPRTVFEAKPFTGKIVDAETGQPIPNAVVYVNWPKTTSTFGGSNQNGVVEVQEAISDSSGQYKMLGWKKSRKEVGKGWFLRNGPEMVIYAPGYWPTNRYNINRDNNRLARNEAWKSDWDGKTIELKPTHSEKWNNEQWLKYLSSIESYMSVYFMPECPWLKIPNYYLARHRAVTKAYQMGHLYGQNIRVSTVLTDFLTEYRRTFEKDCGVDPKAYFLSHGMTNKEFDECCTSKLLKPTPEEIRANTYYFNPSERDTSIDGRSLDEILHDDRMGK